MNKKNHNGEDEIRYLEHLKEFLMEYKMTFIQAESCLNRLPYSVQLKFPQWLLQHNYQTTYEFFIVRFYFEIDTSVSDLEEVD
jgi:hypothetical protein